MKVLDVRRAAAEATAASATRPAITVIHDADDVRLVVFRLAPGQAIAPHRNASAVTLTVITGRGLVQDEAGEQPVADGESVVFEPNELHGMRADTSELVLLAAITPRPGTRRRPEPEMHTLARTAASDSASGAA